MPSKVITSPSEEPVSLEVAKNHLKVDFDVDDSLINLLITSAREVAEEYTGLKFVTQEVEEIFPQFPGCNRDTPYGEILLTYSPLLSIVSVKYMDTSGAEQTLDATTYDSSTHTKPPILLNKVGNQWPATANHPAAVKVNYQVGYGAAADVPEAIKSAILLMVGKAYEARQDSIRKLPNQSEWLLRHFKVQIFH